MYREVDGVIYLGDSRIGNADVISAIYTTWASGKSSSNVLKAIGTDKLLIRNDLNNMVILNSDAMKSFIDNRVVIIETKESVVEEETIEVQETTNEVPEALVDDTFSIEDLYNLFNKDIDTEKYYYMLLAQENNINCKLVNKMFEVYGLEKTALSVELKVLSQLKVIKPEVIVEFAQRTADEVLDFAKGILVEKGVRFKVGSSVKIEDAIRSGINENLMFPLFSGIQKAPRLKKSKVVKELDKEFTTDIRLKYLKVKQVLSSSRSIKITVTAYNSLLKVFGNEMKKDLSMYAIKSVKMDRYNKEYAEGLKHMIKMLDLILDAYLNNTHIPIETTSVLVKLNKSIRK